MGDNVAINNAVSSLYNEGKYTTANISSNDFANNLVYNAGDCYSIKSNWDYGVTLNEDYIKEIVEKITKKRDLAKITPDNGPEIPKWTGFLPI